LDDYPLLNLLPESIADLFRSMKFNCVDDLHHIDKGWKDNPKQKRPVLLQAFNLSI